MSLQLELWDAEERGKEIGKEIGEEIGRMEERQRIVSVLMKKGRSFEEACSDIYLTPEEIEDCKKRMNVSEEQV